MEDFFEVKDTFGLSLPAFVTFAKIFERKSMSPDQVHF